MARRLTENPFRIRFTVTESAANSHTEIDITLPVAAGRSKVQAVELMAVISIHQMPDPEPGQSNTFALQVTRDSQTALINYDNEDLIYKREHHFRSEDANGIEQGFAYEKSLHQDMTDGDGNGEIILERTIHVSVQGSGNASALTSYGYLLCHLVELSADEVVVQTFADDS